MRVKEFFTRNTIIKLLAIVVVSFVIASFLGNVGSKSLKNCAKDFLYGRGQLIQEKNFDFSEKNAEYENIEITQKENIGQLAIKEINDYVQNIELNFSYPMKEEVFLEVYFTSSEGEEFSEAKRFLFSISEEETYRKLDIRHQIKNLRIDITSEEDVISNIKNISVNKNAQRFTIAGLFQVLYENSFSAIWWDRVIIISIMLIFVGVCIFFDIKKVSSTLFRYRWLTAGVILLFLVVNRYNGDSLTLYNLSIQPGLGNDYIEPVLGEARAIRSDEWIVATPTKLSEQFLDDPYGDYNNIIRGTDTINLSRFALYSAVNPIYSIGIVIEKLFGFDYKYSFTWYAPIILAFLVTIELFLIMTKNNKLLSITGTCMILLSSFYLWWAFPSFILYIHGAFVCAYYFFYSKSVWAKILLGYGTAVCTALFVLILYPAWQVPAGYAALAILVWMIHDNWNKIKQSSKIEIIIIIIALLFCVGILLSYVIASRDYISSITKTVYPGHRIDAGGFSIDKIFNYCAAILFSFRDIGNASENGVCISFFPIPFILAVWMWFKNKKKDWLVSGLLFVSIFLLIYTTIGFPMIVAKCTLMANTVSYRAVDILGYIQVLLFVRVCSIYESGEGFSEAVGGVIAVVISAVTIYVANRKFPGYMPKAYMLVIFVVIAVIAFIIISKTSRKVFERMCIAVIIISLVTGAYVRPIEKGTDAIYSKPLAQEIQEIATENKEAKWLAYGGGIILPSFAISCGAPTINSVNRYPNMELWKKLDPTGKYDMIYNRYAHIVVEFTEEETSMELLQPDCFQLMLSYKDMELAEVKYIVSIHPLFVDNEYVKFSKIYSEAGSYIYEVQYK